FGVKYHAPGIMFFENLTILFRMGDMTSGIHDLLALPFRTVPATVIVDMILHTGVQGIGNNRISRSVQGNIPDPGLHPSGVRIVDFIHLLKGYPARTYGGNFCPIALVKASVLIVHMVYRTSS